MVEVDPSLVCVRAVALRARGREFRPVRVQSQRFGSMLNV